MKPSASALLICLISIITLQGKPGVAAGKDAAHAPAKPTMPDSEASTDEPWIKFDGGKLKYRSDNKGNRIPDFSMVGYRGGIVPLPGLPGGARIPIVLTLEPGSGDQTQAIQTAIDRAAAMPLNPAGLRGGILLKAGKYLIAGQLKIVAGGIVLLGEGNDDKSGTVLLGTGKTKRSLIVVGGATPPQRSGEEYRIAEAFVPIGATSFRLANPHDLRVGDPIAVVHPGTEKWLKAIGMSQLKDPWEPGRMTDQRWDRIVTAVSGDMVTINAPITCALDAALSQSVVYKTVWPDAVENVGIANLQGDSEYAGATDEEHAWTFVSLESCQHVWVSQVVSRHFGYACVEITKLARHVTVTDCQFREGISQFEGGRRYSFVINGQLSLVRNCASRDSRHDFVNNDWMITGPNVFVDCKADKSGADTGPHRQWTTGILYDNVAPSKEVDLENKGNSGSVGHGWAGVNGVIWNCRAALIKAESPPTGYNWVFGSSGQNRGSGVFYRFGDMVQPRSLYYAQLQERLQLLGYRSFWNNK